MVVFVGGRFPEKEFSHCTIGCDGLPCSGEFPIPVSIQRKNLERGYIPTLVRTYTKVELGELLSPFHFHSQVPDLCLEPSKILPLRGKPQLMAISGQQ